MSESLSFHFEGALAEKHRMDFYESARFQYAAARLLVKLAQFRHIGRFQQKITKVSNIGIELVEQTKGSFNINVEAPSQREGSEQFAKLSLSDLIAYVSERIIAKVDQTEISTAELEVLDGTTQDTAQRIGFEPDSNPETGAEIFRLSDIAKRRIAETNREQLLLESGASISKIDPARAQKLTSMAAPLISEMATALRRSANSLEIYDNSNSRKNTILFLDRRMAEEIETSKVDTDITTILGDIVQFNKDNGWGKLRIESGSKIVNFNIPSDLLPNLKQKFIQNMGRDKVYLQACFVRDAGGEVVRLIVVGALQLPED